MKLTDLIELLQKYEQQHGDNEVMIPVYRKDQMGPTACVPVNNAIFGFDWDRDKFFILPAITLTIKDE